MKKRLLFALGALMALPTMAQEEDVTHYIQNAGFDTDLTWQADGATKEIVSTDHVLSNRSFAYVAEDNTVYAFGRGKRADGYAPAWNGFFGQIAGWTAGDKSYTGKSYYPYGSDSPEWVYFGTVPYNLGSTAIPIADDGTTFLVTPSKPEAHNGDDNKAFLYLRAGWGGAATYKQTVNLPCAQYRLEYWAINTNPNATKGSNLSRVVCRKDTWKDETGFNDTEWTLHTIEFTPTSEFTMEFGFKSDGGSGSNPFLCIDGIKLYKIGEADAVKLLKSDISDVLDEFSKMSGMASSEGFVGLAEQIGDWAMNDEYYDMDNQEELEAFLREANAMKALFTNAMELLETFNSIYTKMETLLINTSYPGKDALQEAQLNMLKIKEGELGVEADYATLIINAIDEAKEAIQAYYWSQEATATVENPANFTFLVNHPWFIDEEAEPIWSEDDQTWIFPKQYDEDGNDLYNEGSSSSPNLNSGGWYVAGVGGGDQRLNWVLGRSCWNAWNNNFTSAVAVAQNLTDLPNGYYTVSADLVTKNGCITDQHVYAQSVVEKKTSAATLTIEGWDSSEWENIAMTTDEKVLVTNGTLTIGAEGTGIGGGTEGWFCVTNFRLNYLGKATDEDIRTALKKAFDTKIASANELASTMHFAADKKALNDTIARYEGATDTDAYNAALTALETAIAEAQKSEALYYEYLPTQEAQDENPDLRASKTLYWVQDLLDNIDVDGHDPFTEEVKPIAQFALDYVNSYIVCDSASYKQFEGVVNLLKNYVNNYIPAYYQAETAADAASSTGKAALTTLMDKQKNLLTTEMRDGDTVNAYITELKALIDKVKKQSIYENPNATDYTAFIKNPNAEALDGWNVEKGNGDGNGQKSGQWYDDSSTRYFDSYNSAGLKNFKFTQLIEDLPNATYNLGVYTRTPAEGAYVLYALDNDTIFTEIPLDYYFNEETETMEIASDKYGPLWEEAQAQVETGSIDDAVYAIYNANSGMGRGWKHQEMTNIEVKNHQLLIGCMAGTEDSKTEKVFSGNWFSAGGWTLTLVSMGDNSGWNGPIGTGIANVIANSNTVTDGIYSLSGVKTNKLQRGVNIIINNGNVHKIIVK